MSFDLNKRKLLKYFTFPMLGIAAFPTFAVAAGKGEAKQTPVGNYILQSQITGTIMSGNRNVGIMQANVAIYTVDNNLKKKLSNMQPIIVSKWRSALQYYSTKYYVAGTVPDANLVAGLLQNAIAKEIGSARARVLIIALIAR